MLDPTTKVGDIPFHTRDQKNRKTMLQKYCTGHFKRDPIRKFIRKEFNATYKNPVAIWLGYSIDEAFRIKDSDKKYEIRRYPLIEERLYRQDCELWLAKHGFDFVERSACIFCPYRRDTEWLVLPEGEKVYAEELEKQVNDVRGIHTAKEGTQSELRFHKSLDSLSDRPYENKHQLNLFDDIDDVCGGESCWT